MSKASNAWSWFGFGGYPVKHEYAAEKEDGHECGIYLCCLRHLVSEVMEHAPHLMPEVGRDRLEAAYELLFIHIEEAWDVLDEDIKAPKEEP